MLIKISRPSNHLFINNKCVRFIFVLATITVLTMSYRRFKNDLLIISSKIDHDISCHYLTEDETEDVLPAAENITPQPNSIFFHETSCTGGMNSRQACVVESAARLHPHRQVYVFFNSPILYDVMAMSCLNILKQIKNVRLARLHSIQYGKGTVLEEMLAFKNISRSRWPVEHTADILRIVTLHKYGGVYLDTDILLIKSLDDLGKNWAGRENERVVNNAAMAFDAEETGRNLTAIILKEVKETYQPNEWAHNGAGALKRALSQFCNTSKVNKMSAANCKGFQVYDPRTLYAIPWEASSVYFEKGLLPHIVAFNKDKVYGLHLWNNMSKKNKVEIHSPFERLARKYCPTVRLAFGDLFGT